MSSQPASTPKSKLPGDDRNIVAADGSAPALSFEERVQLLWHENKKAVVLACVAVLAIFVGKELVKIYLDARERALAAAFADASSNMTKMRAFAAEHPDNGLAWLVLADDALKAGKYSDATANYTKAAAVLAGGPFSSRAEIGAAFSLALGGDKAKAEESFKKLADDPKQMRATRAEANFQLAILARDAGRVDDARDRLTRIFSLDPQGIMNRQVMAELESLPPKVLAPGEAVATPQADIKLTVPGKP